MAAIHGEFKKTSDEGAGEITMNKCSHFSPTIRPVLFLDIDGVLNTISTMIKHRSNAVFTPEAIESLEWIVSATDCSVVISSSWRKDQMKKLADALDFNGLGVVSSRIIGMTPLIDSVNAPSREDEVDCWIHQNDFRGRFAILDDEPFTGMLKPWQVLTLQETGLTRQLAKKAIRLLLHGQDNNSAG